MSSFEATGADALKAVLEMAPDVAHEMVAWDIGAHSAGFALFLALTAINVYGAVRCFRHRDDDLSPLGLACVCVAAGLLIGVICEGHNALQAMLAPRAYLVEKVLR